MKDLSLQNCRLDGRYDVRSLLGRGSYAEIFLAEDTLAAPNSAHNRVVIKALNVFMHNDLDRDLERTLVENFQNEAIALDRVRHPNILSRLGHGTAQDLNGVMFHYLVLEYLPGGDLAKYCRNHEVSLTKAMDLIEQVCAGLSFAHRNEVIHRDIKPQNLILTEDRKVIKIADFGVARFAESDAPITRVGTNIYAPPEHSPLLSGSTGRLGYLELTPAADIYSLAKTAYVLITAESPKFFSNRTIEGLPQSVNSEPWGGALLEVLRKATLENPRDRHQTVGEFWIDLSRLKTFVPGREILKTTPGYGLLPRPAVARGYSPNPPIRPKFDTSRELKLQDIFGNSRTGQKTSIKRPITDPPLKEFGNPPWSPPPAASANYTAVTGSDPPEVSPFKKRNKVRRFATVLVLLALFSVGLYATYNFVLRRAGFPAISAMFGSRNATALMHINLRSGPNTDNPRIGLVTKGSEIRILDSRGHWYRIDIMKHGSPKTNQDYADRGWISGKTRSGSDTILLRGE